MPSRALTNPPQTFAELVRQVRDALITGQLSVDRAYLETYHHTGLLIDAHLLFSKGARITVRRSFPASRAHSASVIACSIAASGSSGNIQF